MLEDMTQGHLRFASSEKLTKVGERTDSVVVLLEGLGCVFKLLPNGRRQILSYLLPGDMSDPRQLLAPAASYSSCVLWASRIALLSLEAVHRLERYPNIVLAIGRYSLVNQAIARGRYANAQKMNFEAPLTMLVWITSVISVVSTYLVSYLLIPSLAGDETLWWKLSTIITCGTLAGAIIPELVKVFTSVESSHVKEVVTSSREGGPSLNILSGFVAGNFSAYWIGLSIVALMTVAFLVTRRNTYKAAFFGIDPLRLHHAPKRSLLVDQRPVYA